MTAATSAATTYPMAMCGGDYKRTATEVADGLRALFRFPPELGVGRPRAALHQPWILARERGDDLVHRNVGVGTVVAQVLHVTAASTAALPTQKPSPRASTALARKVSSERKSQ